MRLLSPPAYLVSFLFVALGTLMAGACSGSETATTEPSGPPSSAGKAGKAGSAGQNEGGAGVGGSVGGAGAGGSVGGAGAGGSVGGAGVGGSVGGAGVGGSVGGAGAGGSVGGAGVGGSVGGSDMDGGVAGNGQAGNGMDPDAACVAQSAEATLAKKPVDVIFLIDNSGSMTGEIIAVQNNINKNFAKIIADSGLDYRVIMISRHGTATSGQSICISAPLSGSSCSCTAPNGPCSNVPKQPENTANFFHYSVEIGSTNSLSQALSTYDKLDEFGLAKEKSVSGWKVWLRKNSLKVFVEITDDNQSKSTSATIFDDKLLALPEGYFGTKSKRNYIFHSITGIKANKPESKPWLPTDPVQTGTCGSGAVNNGSTYQDLSILTGGLRFPICNNAGFDVVFQTIAEGVVEGSVIDCTFPIPAPPPGETIDPSTIVINYTPGNGGAKETFGQVLNEAACDKNSFYVKEGEISLCPSVCGKVQADLKAEIQLLYGCGKI